LRILWDTFNNGNNDEYYRLCSSNDCSEKGIESIHFGEVWLKLYVTALDMIILELTKSSADIGSDSFLMLWRLLFNDFFRLEVSFIGMAP